MNMIRGNDTRPISILLVDVDMPVLRSLARQLQGYTLHLAYDVPAALEILEHTDVDLVLTDCDMPGQDGLSLLEMLRRCYPNIRRVLMSADPPPHLNELHLMGLVEHFIPKPFRGAVAQEIMELATLDVMGRPQDSLLEVN